MAIRKNPDGRTSTVTPQDSTGTNRGGGTPINRRSLAKSNTASAKILPRTIAPVPRKQR